jgi:hypothetical protein
MIEKLGGIRAIQSHVATLTEYLYERMANLRHSNGKPMLLIFGKHHFANSRQVRAGRCLLKGCIGLGIVTAAPLERIMLGWLVQQAMLQGFLLFLRCQRGAQSFL